MYSCMYVGRYVCMYVCMFVCMYVSMYLCIYVCMYVCMYVSMYLCIYVSIYLSIYVCMYICMSTWLCLSAYVCLGVCTHACVYACKTGTRVKQHILMILLYWGCFIYEAWGFPDLISFNAQKTELLILDHHQFSEAYYSFDPKLPFLSLACLVVQLMPV